MADKQTVENSTVKATETAAAKKTKKTGEKKVSFLTKVKSFFARIAKYFRDTASEMKKVVWPSKKDVQTNTITVLVVVVVAAVFMVLLDLIFGGVIHLMIGV